MSGRWPLIGVTGQQSNLVSIPGLLDSNARYDGRASRVFYLSRGAGVL